MVHIMKYTVHIMWHIVQSEHRLVEGLSRWKEAWLLVRSSAALITIIIIMIIMIVTLMIITTVTNNNNDNSSTS